MQQKTSVNQPATLPALRSAGFPILSRAGRQMLGLILTGMMVSALSGCHGPNHFFAETMPDGLRLMAEASTKEVDLSRLASATGGSETIGPGDVLEVTIAAGLTDRDKFVSPSRVGEDGSISLPDIGTIEVAGLPPEAAEAMITSEAIRKDLYQNPAVTVTIRAARMNHVRVLGAVKTPGPYKLLPNSSDVVSAIAAAGGLAEDAGEEVEVRNPKVAGKRSGSPSVAGEQRDSISPVSDSEGGQPAESVSTGSRMNSYTINLISAAKEGEGSYMVHDGGVIMVEKRDPDPVSVNGLVRKPGNHKIPIGHDWTLLGAIAEAGGVSNQLADKVIVIRKRANSREPAVIQVSLRQAKRSSLSNIIIGPGDEISVEQTPATVMLDALQIIRFGISGSLGPFF
jgi:polysaccharide biosynthesis/export protein